jgi:CPA1 family monovalent cation:H+ antiporter
MALHQHGTTRLAYLRHRAGGEGIPWRHQAIIFWGGGMRGALPLVLVLSLPPSFAQRQLVLDMTAGVVLFNLLVAGTTSGRLVRSARRP